MNDLLEELRKLPSGTSLGAILPFIERYAIAASYRSQPPSDASTSQPAPHVTPQTAKLLELHSYPDSFLVTGRDVSILLDRSQSCLATWRSERRPPPFIKGRPVHYRLGSIRKFLQDLEDQSQADIEAASLKNIRRMTTLDDTFPVFKFESGLQLGYEAAADYHERNEEEAYQSVEILCLGEFKHMQLGQQLLESPLPAIAPDVAKDFDAATWLFLELTNGKPLPVFDVVEALRHLKQSGNDINQPNNLLQRNVAHMLASYGRLKPDETTILMEEFLALGLDIYAPDFEGKNALDLAPEGGNVQVWEKRRNFAKRLEANLTHKEEKQKV